MSISLLYKKYVDISEKIKVHIPSVGEIMDDEDNYYKLLLLLTATPFEMMVQLDDMGIDFTSLNEYQLFCLLFPAIQNSDTHLVFGNLDLSNFKYVTGKDSDEILLFDEAQDIVIDKTVHRKIGRVLQEINFIEKKNKKPGNEEAKRYLLEKARKKQQRLSSKPQKSQLEDLIVAMVNTKEYHYDFETTRNLSIYQFNASVRQIIKKVNFDNTMIGCYSGTVNMKDINPDQLNWLNNK